jgi:V/A-type H+-transporting ATPase subunit I
MDRVLIVGTKDVMEPAINKLYELNVVHVEDFAEEGEYFHIGKPLKSATPLSEKLLKLRSIKSYLGTKDVIPRKEKKEKVQKDIEANLGTLEQAVTKKMSEKSGLESELKEFDRRSTLLKPYEALGVPLELFSGYENITVFTGTVTGDVEPAIKTITNDYEMFSAPYGTGTVISLFVPNSVAGKVSETLNKNGFMEIEPLREKGEPAAVRKSIDEGEVKVEASLKTVNTELAELNHKYAQFIASSEELLSMDTQKAEAPLKFATSENTFIVEGWLPTVDFDKLKADLEKVTDNSIYVTKIAMEPEPYKGDVIATMDKSVEHHEVNAPVKYNNPKFIAPVQAFTDLFGRPRYDEIDPTILFALVFPIFYGFIVGDIAYGLAILAIALVVKRILRYREGWQILINLMIVCAISSIFFGILFGEFFGFQIAEPIVNGQGGILGIVSLYNIYPHNIQIGPIGPFSLPIERLQSGGPNASGVYVFGIRDLLILTCLVGICHLLLGYALGFRNEFRQHGLKTAILHKASWAFILAGGALLIWDVLPLIMSHNLNSHSMMSPLFLTGAILLIGGLILMCLGEGMMGILELTNPLSNTLSYTRLLAVGLSSVGIAFALNAICELMAKAGTLGLILAIIVFLVGHSVNLLLGLYAPFIQSLRLHYVEFYQKFYKSGGRIYDPFGYNRKYTED